MKNYLEKHRHIILPHLLILGISLCWLSCQQSDNKQIIISTWEKTKNIPGNLLIEYPKSGTIFPPEIPSPSIIWQDKSPGIKNWFVCVSDHLENKLVMAFTDQNQWKPDETEWQKIKTYGIENNIHVTVLGYVGNSILSGANTIIRISPDSVNAAIFYRAVPLPFKHALENLEEIRWHLGHISSKESPPVLLENLPLCGNCHSFTPDGKTLAMDVDYAHDKGSYVISAIEKETILTPDKIITWSDYRREDGENTFGLLSQISPNGRYIASTIKDRSIFVATAGLDYSQLFFPIKGIIALYDRNTKKFWSFPGANDPDYVQSNPTWSPDGKYIYFARAPVYHSREAEKSGQIVLPTSMATEFIDGKRGFKYDIYRIPFNQGRGGIAEPVPGASNNGMSNFFPRLSPDGKWLVFTQAKNFMLLQPDSKLYILPAEGSTSRQMTCNTASMNSWHSWSPNGKWLVFSSKWRGPYADFLLTHIDDMGQDSPPVWLEHLSFANLSGNIPEFVNNNFGEWTKIVDNFSNQIYYYFTIGRHNFSQNQYQKAIEAYDKVLKLDSTNVEAYIYKGHAEYTIKEYQKAIEMYDKALALNSNDANVYTNRGTAKYHLKDYRGAIESYNKAIKFDKMNSYAYFARGSSKAKLGYLQSALADFNKSIELGYQSGDIFYERALSRALLGDTKEAVKDFKVVLKLDPKNFDAWEKLGTGYYKLKQYNDAIASYNQAITLHPNESDIYAYRGFCKLALKDFYGAIDDFNQAISLDPSSAKSYYHRGLLEIKLGQKEAGYSDLYKAAELGFKNAKDEIRKYCTE